MRSFILGKVIFDVPNFPRAVAEISLKAMQGKPMRRALDIGCAVGRTSFELAKKTIKSNSGAFNDREN